MNHAMQIIQSPESSSNQGLSWDTAASQGSCKPLAMATPKSAAANAGPSLRPSPNIQTVPWGRGESRSNFLQRQKISKNLWLWCRLLACGAWHVLPMFTSWKFYEDKHYIFFLWFFGFSSLLPTHQLQVPCLFGLRGGDLPSHKQNVPSEPHSVEEYWGRSQDRVHPHGSNSLCPQGSSSIASCRAPVGVQTLHQQVTLASVIEPLLNIKCHV